MRRAGSCAVWRGMWLALNATMNKMLQGTRLSRLETPPRTKEGLLEIRKIRTLAPLSRESRAYFDLALDNVTLLLQRMAIRARPSLPLPLSEPGYQTNVVPRNLNPLCVFFKISRKPWDLWLPVDLQLPRVKNFEFVIFRVQHGVWRHSITRTEFDYWSNSNSVNIWRMIAQVLGAGC